MTDKEKRFEDWWSSTPGVPDNILGTALKDLAQRAWNAGGMAERISSLLPAQTQDAPIPTHKCFIDMDNYCITCGNKVFA